MKKKIFLSVGLLTAAATPAFAAVACSNSKKSLKASSPTQHVEIAKVDNIDTSAVDSLPSFSVASLQQEAKKIGWTDQVWKNGITYEAMSQQINLLFQIALAEGMDMKSALANAQPEPYHLITDSIASMKPEDALKAFNVSVDQDNINDFNKLANLGVDNAAVSDNANAIKISSLYPGNGTIDDADDMKRGLFTSKDSTFLQPNPVDPQQPDADMGINGSGDLDLSAYYDNSNGEREQVTFVGSRNSSVGQFIRELDFKQVAKKYPIISADMMNQEYLPIIKATLYKYVSMMVNLLSNNFSTVQEANGAPIIVTPIRLSAIPTAIITAVNFIIEKNWDQTNNSVKINDKLLENAVEKINNNQSMNWLAIKAFYLGLDKTFMAPDMLPWVRQDRFKDVKFDGGIAGFKEVVPKEVDLSIAFKSYDDTIDSNDLPPIFYLLKEWNSAKSFMNFNPVKSIAENASENGQPVNL